MKPVDRLLQTWRISKARPYVPHGARVLDIGCGNGEFYFQVPDIAEYVGIDPGIECSVHRGGFHLLKGYFPAALPDDRLFDAIVMLAALEHIPPPEYSELARGCRRYLLPQGRLAVTVPSAAVDRILRVLRAVRLVEGMELEQHHGFDPEETTRIFCGAGLSLSMHATFQLGFNHLFVFSNL